MAADIKLIIRSNVRALLGLEEGQSGVQKLIDMGIPTGNAQRVLSGIASVGVDTLDQVAGALGVQPWQLMVPNLDPANLPTVDDREFRWPFKRIDPDQVLGLVGSAAAAVETGLLVALASAGVSARKRNGTTG